MISSKTNLNRIAAIFVAGTIATISLAACGGDSKPAYCADRSQLEDSVRALPGLVTDADPSALQTQVETIKTEAGALADAAQSDFPGESESVETAVEALRSGVNSLPAKPSAAEYATVGLQAATVLSAINNFSEATKSECD